MDRQIIHVDMDAFFAAVEENDNPELKGKPVMVGGGSKRGVVCTCSYEARKYGIHSAMPGFIARKKCPHGIFLPVRMGRYKEVSKNIFDILFSVTDVIEPLSIDEAYLDITDVGREPLETANWIKSEVKKKTGLTISVGISYNKFLAKLASDWNKPDGLKIITKDMVPDILLPLSINRVYGLGKKSTQKLNRIGIYTIKDLMNLPKEYLVEYFGKYGVEIYDRIRGIDNRKVRVSGKVKSIGRETTLIKDTRDKELLRKSLLRFSENISLSLSKRDLSAKTVTIKIKTSKFENHTKGKTIHKYISSDREIYTIASEILEDMKLEDEIRLIGLSVSNFIDNKNEQLSFLDGFWGNKI